MIFGDLHVHSLYSNGYYHNLPPWVASSPEEILKKTKERGLKVVAIADHDSLKGSDVAMKLAEKYEIIVVPACEITSADGHILAYGIRKEIPKRLSAPRTIDLIHEQGGLAIAAHPFISKPLFFLKSVSLGEKVLELDLDGIDVTNTSGVEANSTALGVIKKRPKLAQIGGSDSHVLDFIGSGRTVFLTKISTAADVLMAIKTRETKGQMCQYVSYIQKVLASFRDQFKFLLSGEKGKEWKN